MSETAINVLVAIALGISATGIVVQVLPGTFLAAGALLVWAIVTGGALAWTAFGIAAVILALGQLLKYLLPGRSMSQAGVSSRSMLVGFVLAIVGFFVIPFVGLFVGFVLGVYLSEHVRLRDWEKARQATWVAMKATGFSILIELGALLLAASAWVAAVIAGAS